MPEFLNLETCKNATKPRETVVDVCGQQVAIRSMTASQFAQQEGAEAKAHHAVSRGDRIEAADKLVAAKLQAVRFCVLAEPGGAPLFTTESVAQLAEGDAAFLEAIYVEVTAFSNPDALTEEQLAKN